MANRTASLNDRKVQMTVNLTAKARGWLIGSVLLFSFVAAFFAWSEPYAAPVLLAAAVFTFFVIRNSEIGLFGFVIVFLMIPLPSSFGSLQSLTAGILVLILLIGIWIFKMVAIQRRIEIQATRLVRSMFVFAAVSGLAYLAGFLPWLPIEAAPADVQLGALGIFILSMAIALLVGHQIDRESSLKRLVALFLIIGSIFMVGTVISPIAGIADRLLLPHARGSMFFTWLLALAFGQVMLNTDLDRRLRAGLMIVGLLSSYLLFILKLDWVSGWLPALTAVATIIWIAQPRWRILYLMAGAIVTFLIFQSTLGQSLIYQNEYSLLTRSAAYDIMFEIIKVNPILGLGPANYYHYTPLFPILGWYVSFNSHNQYVDIIAQIGLLGLGVFIWFCVEHVITNWRLQKQAHSPFVRAYLLSCLGGMAGMLVSGFLGDWFFPFVYNIGVNGTAGSFVAWVFLGGVIAIERIGAQEKNPF